MSWFLVLYIEGMVAILILVALVWASAFFVAQIHVIWTEGRFARAEIWLRIKDIEATPHREEIERQMSLLTAQQELERIREANDIKGRTEEVASLREEMAKLVEGRRLQRRAPVPWHMTVPPGWSHPSVNAVGNGRDLPGMWIGWSPSLPSPYFFANYDRMADMQPLLLRTIPYNQSF